MPSVTKPTQRYLIELALALLVYAAAIYGRWYAAGHVTSHGLAVAITVSPVLGIWLAGLAMFRHYRNDDEYQKLGLLKMFAASAALTVAIIASWDVFEDAGAPPLSSEGVLGVFGGILVVCAILMRRADVVESGSRIKQFAWAVLVAAAVAAAYRMVADAESWPAVTLTIAVPCLAVAVWIALQMLPARKTKYNEGDSP
jgi:hypothetical protein